MQKEVKRIGGENKEEEEEERTKNILTTALWRANWIKERLQRQGKRKEYNSVPGIEN